MSGNNPEAIKRSADSLASYAATCQMDNTLEWMEGLCARINEYARVAGHNERVQTDGRGLELFIEPMRKP